MGIFKPTYRLVMTIWPYIDGYGVVQEQFGKVGTVCSSGLSKKEAEEDLAELEKLNES